MRRAGGTRTTGEVVEGTRIRRLEERDIDAAIALTDLEAWGYTREDFRRLLALSPNGCFAAERDGRVVGVLTTTTYDGLAFLGAVIVAPELRGKGVGKELMEATLAHLQATGVRTVRLNAYLNAIPFYERLEFHREYEVIRWHGPASAAEKVRAIRPIREDDLAGLARMDAKYFGANRQALLARLASEFAHTFLVAERGGRPKGFIVGNPSGDACEIGPWVVEPAVTGVAQDLFHALVRAAGSSEVALSGPSQNRALLEFVRGAGFEEVFRALRMWWGANDFPGDPAGIWAAGGLEKG
ncbi:MAG: GNAT family N-acetyltransferase [Methanobacteriota archaeon]|nr:MAG: GNAT family N-acetyltransferase [Euryarchaeota archaeon]TLZ90029.1 MAG: GNAT family N-acetyltransferase [Euryarchaeota archaeon]